MASGVSPGWLSSLRLPGRALVPAQTVPRMQGLSAQCGFKDPLREMVMGVQVAGPTAGPGPQEPLTPAASWLLALHSPAPPAGPPTAGYGDKGPCWVSPASLLDHACPAALRLDCGPV